MSLQGFLSTHRWAAQLEQVSVVVEPVADGVGDSRTTERFVPSFRRHLPRDHGRRLVLPVLDYFEQATALDVGHRVEQEVVEDEHIDP